MGNPLHTTGVTTYPCTTESMDLCVTLPSASQLSGQFAHPAGEGTKEGTKAATARESCSVSTRVERT